MSLRYAIRTLAGTPTFTAMAVVTIALGIGINTAVFTIYDSVALRQLAVRAPEEIFRFQRHSNGIASDQFSWSDYQRLATETRAPVIATSAPQTIACKLPTSMHTVTQLVHVRFVSNNYFDALGVSAVSGRAFSSSDAAVAIVSHGFWTQQLDSDPAIYGKSLTVGGVAVSILGVTPKGFAGTGVPPETPDLWMPASAQSIVMQGTDWVHDDAAREWQVIGRRNRREAASRTSAELAILSRSWPKDNGKSVQLSAVHATYFQTDSGGFQAFADTCAILMVAVSLILLIGCVNLVNLIAARNAGRAHEIAVRLALGATRWRLVKQFCTESLVLGVVGGAAGLLLSIWTCDWLATKAMEMMRAIANGAAGISLDLSPDWRVFLWTATLSATTGIAVGILPALNASRGDVSTTLKQGAAGAGFLGMAARRKRNLLLSAQVASCLVLLTAAGLLFRGAAQSAVVAPGFDVQHLALVGMNTGSLPGSAAARSEIQRQAIARLEALPEVASVAWADRSPFLGTGSGPFSKENGALLASIFNGVSDNYFRTLGVPLLSGRTFTIEEIDRESPVAVISESTAKLLWRGKSPLGKKIIAASDWLKKETGHDSLTVIGVAKTVRSTYLSKEDEGYVYMPRRLRPSSALFLVRTRVAPERSFKSLSSALAAVNANLPSRTYIVSLEQGPIKIQELMAQAPASAALVLGGLALVLACVGIYGVVSQLVVQRTREIGIRVALGASRRDVIATVGSQTMRPVAWGTVAGLAGAFAVSGLLRAFIVMPDFPDLTYGAGAFDPATFSRVLFVLAAVVLIAAFLPMRRATLVDPAVALRDE